MPESKNGRRIVIERVAEEYNLTLKLATAVVDTVVDGMICALKSGERLNLKGFGTFVIEEKPSRTARHPQNGEVIQVPARWAARFSASKNLKGTLR